MSSRSNGVTKVEFSRERIAWVTRSPSCSCSVRRLAFISGSTKSSTMSRNREAASATLPLAASKRSKKVSSRGKMRSLTLLLRGPGRRTVAGRWTPEQRVSDEPGRQTCRRSAAAQDDAVDRLGDPSRPVERLLELVDDVLPDQHVAGRVLDLEGVQPRPRPPVQPVTLVLQVLDPGRVGAQRL